MSEMKYTSGPWLIEECWDGEEFEIYPKKDGPPELGRWAEICTVKNYHDSAKADAHLIAAAPDMLEALKALVNLDRRCGWHSEARDAAEAAIFKAELRA